MGSDCLTGGLAYSVLASLVGTLLMSTHNVGLNFGASKWMC